MSWKDLAVEIPANEAGDVQRYLEQAQRAADIIAQEQQAKQQRDRDYQQMGAFEKMGYNAGAGIAESALDVMNVGTRVGESVAEKLGAELPPVGQRISDDMVRHSQQFERDMPQGRFGKGWRGVVRTISNARLLRGLGATGIAPLAAQAAAITGNEALTEASDAGLTGAGRIGYAGGQAGIEGGITLAMGGTGRGGLETVLGGGAKEVAKAGWRGVVKQVKDETLEEAAILASSSVLRKAAGVDPNATDIGPLASGLTDVAIQSAMGVGAANVPNLAANAAPVAIDAARYAADPAYREYITEVHQATKAKNSPEREAQRAQAESIAEPEAVNSILQKRREVEGDASLRTLAEKDAPSRKDFEQAGLPSVSGDARKRFAENLRSIFAAEPPQAPVKPPRWRTKGSSKTPFPDPAANAETLDDVQSQPTPADVSPLAETMDAPLVEPAKKPSRPLWEMDASELNEAADVARASEDKLLNRLFGPDRADRYRAALLNMHSTDDARATKAREYLEESAATLNDQQRKELNDTFESESSSEALRPFIGSKSFYAPSPYDLGVEIAADISNVSEQPNTPIEGMRFGNKLSASRILEAQKIAKKNGWNPSEVGRGIAEELAKQFPDAGDRQRILDGLPENVRKALPSVAPRALPAPRLTDEEMQRIKDEEAAEANRRRAESLAAPVAEEEMLPPEQTAVVDETPQDAVPRVDTRQQLPPMEIQDEQAQPEASVKPPGLEVAQEPVAGPVEKPKKKGVRKVKQSDVHHGGGVASAVTPSTGAVAGFATQPAETKGGKKLLAKLHTDNRRKGKKQVGLRSIVDYVNDAVGAMMLVGKTQTSRKNPAHYLPSAHLIRSRTGAWQLNFHEAGHALSALLADKNRDWRYGLGERLKELTDLPGSMASAHTSEEGMAEWVRLYVTDQGRLPDALKADVSAAIIGTEPDTLKALRDAHRAYQFHVSRPLFDQAQSLANDKPSKGGLLPAVNSVWEAGLFNLIGGSTVVNRLIRRAHLGIAGDRSALGTGFLGVSRELLSKGYASQQKLAREVMAGLKDGRTDIEAAYQSKLRSAVETSLAMGGSTGKKEGIRVLSTDGGFGLLADEDLQALEAAGFTIPAGTKHGEFIYLNDKSYAKVKRELGDRWNQFEVYGQYRTALERYQRERQDYPGRQDGLTPDKIEQMTSEMLRENPDFNDRFKDVQEYMDQLMLVGVLSGELPVNEAIAIKTKWYDYWPLPRQKEDAPSAMATGGLEPTIGLKRAFGSPLPFKSLDEAVLFRTRMAMDAYYNNRFMKAVRDWAAALNDKDAVPFAVRKEAMRLMLPLKLERKPAATLTKLEEATIVADAMNNMEAERLGIPVSELETKLEPEDIVLSAGGVKIWRSERPNAVNVVAVFDQGVKQYYQVPDPVLFQLFSRSASPHKYVSNVGRIIGGMTDPWKRAITQSLPFAMRNMPRDTTTAVGLSNDWAGMVPGAYGAIAIVNRITGRVPDAKVESELLSKALDHTSRDSHQTIVESFKDMLKEGLVIQGWSDMDNAERAMELPGWAMSAALKPVDVVNFLTGGRHLSRLTESLPREGAFIASKDGGASTEQAMQRYDTATGNFSQKPGSANVATIYRMAGFFNPMVQIMYQSYAPLNHPDPQVRAFHTAVKLPWLAVAGATAAFISHMMIRGMYDDDEQEKVLEDLRQRTENDRTTHMAVAGKLRLPFDGGPIGGFFSYGYNSMEEYLLNAPIEGKHEAIAKRLITLPGVDNLAPPVIRTGGEMYQNYSYYYDDEIVPEWLEKKYPYNPELQTYSDVPELYNQLGRGLKISPIKLRYGIRQIFSSVADDVAKLADPDLRGSMVAEPANIPLAGRLATREPRGFSSQSVRSVIDLDEKYQALKTLAEDAERQGGIGSEKAQELEAKMVELGAAHKAMLAVEKIWDDVKEERSKSNPNREAMRQLERDMTATAAAFLRSTQNPDDFQAEYIGERMGALRSVWPLSVPKDKKAEFTTYAEYKAWRQKDVDESLEFLKSRNISRSEALAAFEKATAKLEPENRTSQRAAFKRRTKSLYGW